MPFKAARFNFGGLYFLLILFALILPAPPAAFASGPAGEPGGDGTVTGAPQNPGLTLLAKGGPPPHAPAHGYRAKHQYRYYPGASVYYDTGRRLWFYIKAGDWTFGASLPAELKVQLGEHVSIGMDEDRPYLRNAEHATQYPAEKYKKK